MSSKIAVLLYRGNIFLDMQDETKKTTFGAGCFWGIEAAFKKLKGVISATSGYMGGHKENPTYEDVCTGKTGHAEAVEVVYDPQKITYQKLLEVFWKIHDPTTLNRQGPDIGSQYRSAIFYHDEEQGNIANESKKKLEESKTFKSKIVTKITPAALFYKAEEYHQNYYEKHGINSCGIKY